MRSVCAAPSCAVRAPRPPPLHLCNIRHPFPRCIFVTFYTGTLMESEVECLCGAVQCIGDMKRGVARASFLPHPHLSSDEEQAWQQMNTAGSEQRSLLMRYKNCPKCGTMTTKCGCSGQIVCGGMDKCPNEACDHMKV